MECIAFFGIVLYYLVRLISTAGRLNDQMETNATTLLDIQKQWLVTVEKHVYNWNGDETNQIPSQNIADFQNKVLVGVSAIEDTRKMMVEQYAIKPITFLGLKAGPQLFTTIGTLVVTAGSSFFSQVASR